MLSLNKLKYLRSLELKKNRSKEKKIVLDGYRLINEALSHNINIEHVWIENSNEDNLSYQDLVKKIKDNKISFSYENKKDIKKICNTKHSQGILALASIDGLYNDNLNNFDNRIVILDQISDPGNLGTIIRTCAWFGIKSILMTENSSDIFNYKCIRSSMGGHFLIKNLTYLSYEAINNFLTSRDIQVLGADLTGTKINEVKGLSNWALVLGSEAHGLTGKIKNDIKVTIENYGQMESLNVSVATGILLNNLVK